MSLQGPWQNVCHNLYSTLGLKFHYEQNFCLFFYNKDCSRENFLTVKFTGLPHVVSILTYWEDKLKLLKKIGNECAAVLDAIEEKQLIHVRWTLAVLRAVAAEFWTKRLLIQCMSFYPSAKEPMDIESIWPPQHPVTFSGIAEYNMWSGRMYRPGGLQ